MSNAEGMYPVYFIKMTKQSETILRNLSAFGGFCGSHVLKLTKRSIIIIRRSMLDVRCLLQSAFGGFDVQSVHSCSQEEFHISTTSGRERPV